MNRTSEQVLGEDGCDARRVRQIVHALDDAKRALGCFRERAARGSDDPPRDTLSAEQGRPEAVGVEDLGRSLNYKAISVLGEGAHGVVLLVEHKRLAKRFVMKLIQQKFLANRDVVGRFIAEAQRGAKLDHEAFAPIVDLGEAEDGRTYFVMEYVEGITLQQALRERGPFPPSEAVDLAIQLLDGLAAAHDAHLIHRDIKPANLFLTTRRRLKILDLGISKSILDTGTGPHTAAGIAIGTPKYMSPEQALGRAVTYSTDVYAVGLVLFEMLAGVPAFDGANVQEILRHQIYTPAPSLQQRTGSVFPDVIERVLSRALAKDPLQRFQTAREMIDALRATALASSAASGSIPPVDDTANENARPTVKLDGALPPEAFGTARVSDERAAPSAPPPSHSSATRPVPANALVLGAATTSPQAVIVPHTAMEMGTAQTEAVPAMQSSDPQETGGATTRTHDEQRNITLADAPRAGTGARPLLFVAAALVGLATVIGSVALLIFVMRDPRDATPRAALQPIAAAKSEPASAGSSGAIPVAPSAPLPSASASMLPAPSASAKVAVTSTKPKASHYQAAVDAMDAGDLDTADAEARLAVAQGGGTSAQLLHAQILEKRGKKAAARDVYRQILEKDPKMSAAVAGLKRCGG